MKKVLFVLLAVFMIFTLCSCKVNWFTETIDVPWYYVAIPVILIVIPVTNDCFSDLIKHLLIFFVKFREFFKKAI